MEQNRIPIVEFRNVSIENSDRRLIFEDLFFSVYKGDVICILGHNDKDRTLILYSILGQLRPQSGRIKVFGNLLSRFRNKVRLLELRKKIGYVHAQKGLINNITIKENITLPLRFNSYYDPKAINKKFDKVVELFELSDIINNEIWNLDNISIKKVLFARAVINEPQLLLIDEPTTYIEQKDISHIRDLITNALKGDLLAPGCPVIITTEDQVIARYIANRIVSITRGKINYWGETDEFYSQLDGEMQLEAYR